MYSTRKFRRILKGIKNILQHAKLTNFHTKMGPYSGFFMGLCEQAHSVKWSKFDILSFEKPHLHEYKQYWKHPKLFWISVFAYMFWKERVISSYAAAHSLVLSTRGFVIPACINMMTSSNGNIFRLTGPLFGEFTGPRWIPLTKASDAELWRILWSAPE